MKMSTVSKDQIFNVIMELHFDRVTTFFKFLVQ